MLHVTSCTLSLSRVTVYLCIIHAILCLIACLLMPLEWHSPSNTLVKCFVYNKYGFYESPLTAHNLQKWKRVFLTSPCHEIYRDEAVGLKSCKYTWKITIFVKMWNLGQYRENLIFCQ